MKTKIRCGCGLFCADDLNDYDQHLAEHVAEDDGNLQLYMDRTSVESVFTADEIAAQNQDREWFLTYGNLDRSADLYHGMGQ